MFELPWPPFKMPPSILRTLFESLVSPSVKLKLLLLLLLIFQRGFWKRHFWCWKSQSGLQFLFASDIVFMRVSHFFLINKMLVAHATVCKTRMLLVVHIHILRLCVMIDSCVVFQFLQNDVSPLPPDYRQLADCYNVKPGGRKKSSKMMSKIIYDGERFFLLLSFPF